MSQENVDVVLRAIEAFNRHDVAAAHNSTLLDAETDWSRSSGVEAGVYHGRAATMQFWETFFEAFDRVVVTPEQVIDHGDTVVVLAHSHLSGRDGIEVETTNTIVVILRGGRIARWTLYNDHAEALKAAGLDG